MITGNEHGYFMRGKVAIGASSPNLMEEFIEKDDLVILGDREEAQACAVNIDASCMVICKDAEVSPKLIQKAKEQSIVIIVPSSVLIIFRYWVLAFDNISLSYTSI